MMLEGVFLLVYHPPFMHCKIPINTELRVVNEISVGISESFPEMRVTNRKNMKSVG